MAAEDPFRGETVVVSLKGSDKAQVRGRVTDIVNQQLTLTDGKRHCSTAIRIH